MTANGTGILRDNENVLELEREVMGAQCCDYEKPLNCVHFQRVNFMVSESQ